MDSEARACDVRVGDLTQFREQCTESYHVIRRIEVTRDGVEKPKARVRGVIESLLLTLRKEVGYQAVFDVVGESAQNPARFLMAARNQRQAFQADHGVAPPIGEPVVA